MSVSRLYRARPTVGVENENEELRQIVFVADVKRKRKLLTERSGGGVGGVGGGV